MLEIKRIKITESIKIWNDSNKLKEKKSTVSIGKEINFTYSRLSLWNTGSVPNCIKALLRLSQVLECEFDDLFILRYNPIKDTYILARIAIQEALDNRNINKRNLRFQHLQDMGVYNANSLRDWNDGIINISIRSFHKFCLAVELKPSQVIEY